MTFAIVVAVLVVYWFVLVWRVGVERGRVGGETQRAMIRLRKAFLDLGDAMAVAFRPIVERATSALVELGEAMERAGLLDPCPYCGHPPLDHIRCEPAGCVVVDGSLPLRVAVAIPPTYGSR